MATSVLLWAGLGNCSLKIGSGGGEIFSSLHCFWEHHTCGSAAETRVFSFFLPSIWHTSQQPECVLAGQWAHPYHITEWNQSRASSLVRRAAHTPPVPACKERRETSAPCHLAVLPNSLTRAKVPLFSHHYWDKMRSSDLEGGGGGGAEIRWPVTPGGSARLFRSHPPLSN